MSDGAAMEWVSRELSGPRSTGGGEGDLEVSARNVSAVVRVAQRHRDGLGLVAVRREGDLVRCGVGDLRSVCALRWRAVGRVDLDCQIELTREAAAGGNGRGVADLPLRRCVLERNRHGHRVRTSAAVTAAKIERHRHQKNQ